MLRQLLSQWTLRTPDWLNGWSPEKERQLKVEGRRKPSETGGGLQNCFGERLRPQLRARSCHLRWTSGHRGAPVVEAVPGVPTATITAHLDKPRPDLIRWRLDRDGHRRRPLALREQFGARIWTRDFLVGCAPAPQPRAHPKPINDGGHRRRSHDLASECHMASMRSCTGHHQGPMSSHGPRHQSGMSGYRAELHWLARTNPQVLDQGRVASSADCPEWPLQDGQQLRVRRPSDRHRRERGRRCPVARRRT
jgi:hypothetical protein